MKVKVIATNSKNKIVYMSVFTDDEIKDIYDVTDDMVVDRIKDFVHSKRTCDISDLDIVKIQVR